MKENYKEIVKEIFLKEQIAVNSICDTQNS